MIDRLVSRIAAVSQAEHGVPRRLLSLLIGGMAFLVVVPWILAAIAEFVLAPAELALPDPLSMAVAALSVPLGLFLLAWATFTFWEHGGGTPAQSAPTRRLVIRGPYRYCRNPIELGAIIYYLGVGTFAHSLANGLICLALGWILGSSYHKFVEEKELLRRFGEEYERYRRRTPFLVPRLRRREHREA